MTDFNLADHYHNELHHAGRPDMGAFVIDMSSQLLDRGTFIYGHFVTPEQARELQAAQAELDDAVKRAGLDLRTDSGAVAELPAFERVQDVRWGIYEDRGKTIPRRDAGVQDTLDVPSAWVFENLDVTPGNRVVPNQVITPEQLVVSGAQVFLDRYRS